MREISSSAQSPAHPLQVRELKATQGKHVTAGETLCTLVDHHELYIEGHGLRAGHAGRQPRSHARPQGLGLARLEIEPATKKWSAGLDASSISTTSWIGSRGRSVSSSRFAIACFARTRPPHGRRFVYWRFKPGQRTQIRVPVEAVEPTGSCCRSKRLPRRRPSYVFEANGDHFDRRAGPRRVPRPGLGRDRQRRGSEDREHRGRVRRASNAIGT